MLSIHPKSVQILSRDYFELQYFHRDHLGSSTVVTDESGSVIENTTYSPFGEVISGGETTIFGYEGKEHDSVVGDTDFHFRKYKPEWTLFTQPDSLIQNVYDPQSLNRYMFERGNPYKYTDPNGHLLDPGSSVVLGTMVLISSFFTFVGSVLYSKEIKEKDESKEYAYISTENAMHTINYNKQKSVMNEASNEQKEIIKKKICDYDNKIDEVLTDITNVGYNFANTKIFNQANVQQISSASNIQSTTANTITYNSRSNYFRGSSGRSIQISYSKSGGYIGSIKMSKGFAIKVKSALSSLSS